jgi:hypothetical protein
MWNVLGKLTTADGLHAAEAKAAPLVGMLPQLLAVMLGIIVKSVEVLDWPFIRLALEREEDKHALLRQAEITVMDIRVRVVARTRCFAVQHLAENALCPFESTHRPRVCGFSCVGCAVCAVCVV